MPAGSVMGLAGGWPRFSGFFKNAPFLYAETRWSFRAAKDSAGSTQPLLRRLTPRKMEERSRDSARVEGGFGGEFIRTVA